MWLRSNVSDKSCREFFFFGTNFYSLLKRLNTSYNQVFATFEFSKRTEKKQKLQALLDDVSIEGNYVYYNCNCALPADNHARTHLRTKQKSEVNECYVCGMEERDGWRNVSWEGDGVWCGMFRGCYKVTGAIRINSEYYKTSFKAESEEKKNENDTFSNLNYLKCGFLFVREPFNE